MKLNKQVNVWWSSEQEARSQQWFFEDLSNRYCLEQQEASEVGLPAVAKSNETTIAIFPEITYQQILGIGTSMEESTVYNLAKMSPEKRLEVLKLLVDQQDGAGFNLIRITIGTSDFTAQTFYSYNDLPEGETDFKLEHFSIQRDIDLGIIDTVQELLKLNPELKIFGSCWSPPAWMKTTGSMNRGSLKEGIQYVEAYAKYLCKAASAYESLGIPLYSMTMQNEPLLEIDYPSCYMSPEQQAELVVILRQELDAQGLDVKLWIFDHNFSDAWGYTTPILNNKAANEATAGIALHDYEGEPAIMTELKAAYPDKSIYLTERSLWGVYGADRILQFFRNWASSYNAWVTMLDSTIGTHQWVGTPDPTLLVQDASNTDHYWATPEFYLTAQFSRFIGAGAYRIESTLGSAESVTNVAFVNPDGSLVVVIVNQTELEQAYRLVAGGWQYGSSLPAKSAATLVIADRG
ncbi:glycoside hydrolase family 30 protein [Paenibacillus paeoniae]|uniref:Glycosyl hydrolase n=1 Tax=Paenibacillus paeoniae TaxID=2292705 RepID=A0A371P5W2_9BACL|nr:glycoside hydrolase family 30 beta sandwich domain-containing protein [Paenibacillus paeoniae]REK71327.1 glycosyl hydrolase [Paenibacillus paeoniae]